MSRIRIAVLVVAACLLQVGCRTSSDSGCAELDDNHRRLEAYSSALAASAADVVGPRCADGGGALTVEASFDLDALPAVALDHEYTRSDYDRDRRLCFELDHGDLLEILRLGGQVTAVVSSTTYALSCN